MAIIQVSLGTVDFSEPLEPLGPKLKIIEGGKPTKGLPRASSIDTDGLYDYDTDRLTPGRITSECPTCGGTTKPYTAQLTRVRDGLRWVACEYQEPYSDFEVTCSHCRKRYVFTAFTPQ